MQHLVSLSFEHRIGNQIDAVYPPFPDEDYVSSWNQGLPFIGIPDKAHGACSSVIQFTLPNPKLPLGHSYGLAAYRSIEVSELKKSDPTYIRNHVQRSLCIISDVPLFGEIENLLKKLLYDNFDNLVPSLQSIYSTLLEATSKPTPYSGISYSSLFQNLQREVLTVVKSLYLGQRVLIFADNSELVSKMVVAIGSLLPGLIYGDDFPYHFLGKAFSFAPYVPLQFTEALNNSASHSKLMGTCSELFMDQKVVDYDILIDCRKIPALIKGDTTKIKLSSIEINWMDDILKEMTIKWNQPEVGDWIRSQFKNYANAIFGNLLRTRHLRKVPKYIWPYLDWQNSRDVFGDEFINQLLNKDDAKTILAEGTRKQFGDIDPKLTPAAKKTFKFW